MKLHHAAFAVLLGSASFAAFTPAVANDEIGVFAAANQDLTGARPSEASRTLFIQDRVVANERIASSAEGGGQILFLDQSSLTISPNSDIVLDQYVYNADADSGELGLTVLKGAMRLVGGRITKKNAAIIKTPTATIGIRGGMGSTVVGPDGVTRYMHIAGISSTITTDQDELTITREGGFAEVGPDGDIQYLGVAPDDFIGQAYSKKAHGDGSGGGDAGGGKTEGGAGDVERIVSADGDATEQGPISTSGEQQDDSSDQQTFDSASGDADDEATENFIDEVTVEVDQEIDSLFVFGKFDATITADFDGNGTPGVQAEQQDFMLAFSLSRDQGIVLFSLPETGDDLSVDSEVLVDVQATGLDSVLSRVGATSLLGADGVDGFLVSGFPFSSASALDAVSTETGGSEFGNQAISAVVQEPDSIFIEADNSGGRSDVESFAGGAIQQVDLFVDGQRGVNGSFDILYDGNPEFQSLDRVQGAVDLQLQEAGNFADTLDGTTDAIRVLIEEDIQDPVGPGAIVPDPNT